MPKKVSGDDEHMRRHVRVHTKISSTPECPHLNAFRSNSNTHVQIIDDVSGVTPASTSNVGLKLESGGNAEATKTVGTGVMKHAIERNITGIVFDRGGYVYTGRVKALVEAARIADLKS